MIPGVASGPEHTVHDNPPPGLQTYVVPPKAESVVEEPGQTETFGPAVTNGIAFTVTTAVALPVPQPPETVYDIVTAPALTPLTLPAASTVAIPVDPELQFPPASPLASLRLIVEPAQTPVAPVIVPVFADELTDTIAVAVTLPQLLVTV